MELKDWYLIFSQQLIQTSLIEWLAVGFGVTEVFLAKRNNISALSNRHNRDCAVDVSAVKRTSLCRNTIKYLLPGDECLWLDGLAKAGNP